MKIPRSFSNVSSQLEATRCFSNWPGAYRNWAATQDRKVNLALARPYPGIPSSHLLLGSLHFKQNPREFRTQDDPFCEYFQAPPFVLFWNHFLKLIPRPLHLAIGTGPPNIFTTQWWSHGSTAHHRFDEKSSLLTCRSSTSDHQPTKATSFLVFPKLEKHQNNIYIYT